MKTNKQIKKAIHRSRPETRKDKPGSHVRACAELATRWVKLTPSQQKKVLALAAFFQAR